MICIIIRSWLYYFDKTWNHRNDMYKCDNYHNYHKNDKNDKYDKYDKSNV